MLSMERLASCGVIPVVVLNDVADAVPTARALLRGGIDVMEITFRTAAAARLHRQGGRRSAGDDRRRRYGHQR